MEFVKCKYLHYVHVTVGLNSVGSFMFRRILFICFFDLFQKIWNFEVMSLTLECCGRYILPACKQRWVSAAAIGHSSLVCGDRSGTVHVYQLTSEGVSNY